MSNKKSLVFMILGILLSLSVVVTLSTPVLAAEPYPIKPVRIIIPDTPGSGTDVVIRLVAPDLAQRLGKQVIVENRPGGGGIIAAEAVAKAAPDGYTLLIIAAGHAVSPSLYKLHYDPVKSFSPIARLANGPMALTVHPSVPANSVKELIALAKQKPGQLFCASSGKGSNQHLASELFKMRAGIDFTIVQFKGSGPATIDQLGGHSQFSIGSLIYQMPQIKSGKFRLLALGGLKRSNIMPDVPTIAETVPGYEASQWWGVVAPAGTPAPIVSRLDKEIKALLTLPDVQKMFMNEGAEVDYLGSAEFGPFISDEIIKWAQVVKAANVKVE